MTEPNETPSSPSSDVLANCIGGFVVTVACILCVAVVLIGSGAVAHLVWWLLRIGWKF